jgi:hypothetical protein
MVKAHIDGGRQERKLAKKARKRKDRRREQDHMKSSEVHVQKMVEHMAAKEGFDKELEVVKKENEEKRQRKESDQFYKDW